MSGAFAAAVRFGRLSDSLAILVSAAAGLLLAGFPPLDSLRHLVDGSFTFLPIVLIICSAQFFINVQRESGALSAMARDLVIAFHRYPRVLLVLLMFLTVLPGALTGPGAAGQFAFGSLVSSLLLLMKLPRVKVAAFIAMGGVIGTFAPPINVPAMIIAAGINMPYLGFFLPLLLLTVPLAVFSALYLGLRHLEGPLDREKAIQALPPIPEKMKGIRVYGPMILVVGLMVLSRLAPHSLPPIGVALMFLLGAAAAYLLGNRLKSPLAVSQEAFLETLEVNAVLLTVGALVQAMAANGVRGLLVIGSISLPLYVLYSAIFIACCFLGGVLGAFGVASIFGIPFMLALLGRDPILATVGLSIIACVANIAPPTAVLGKSAMILADCRDPYSRFLTVSLVPNLAVGLLGLLLVIFADSLPFLRL